MSQSLVYWGMPEVLTLTLNPCVDVSTATAQVQATHKLRCSEPWRTPGGGGVNVARYLTRLGHDALAMHTAGGPHGTLLRELLRAEGVSQLTVPIAQDTRQSWHVHERISAQEFRFVMPGPTLSTQAWSAAKAAWRDQLEVKPKVVVLSGSLPPGVPPDAYAQLLRACEGPVFTVVDASGLALHHALAVGVGLVKPSLSELRAYSGLGLQERAEQIAAIQSLVTQQRAKVVVLSLGEEGALLAAPQTLCQVNAPATQVVSAVGAGDSLVAGLVSGLLQGMSWPDALAWASAVSAATVSQAPGRGWRKKDPQAFRSRVLLQTL